MKNKRKYLAYILCFTIIMTLLPIKTFAEKKDNVTERTNASVLNYEFVQQTTTPSAIPINPSKYVDDGYEVTFKVNNYWDGEFNGEFTVTNTGEKPLENWYLSFDFKHEICDIWNAEIVSHKGDNYIVKNKKYIQDIPINENITFGFQAKWTNEIIAPEQYSLIIQEQPVASEDYNIDFIVLNDWGSGFNGQISITNNTQETIEDWILEFDSNREIENFWTANIEKHEGGHYVIKNAEYNSNIEPRQTLILGFSAKLGGESINISNFQLKSCNLKPVIEIDQLTDETDTYVVNTKTINLSGSVQSAGKVEEVKYELEGRNGETITGTAEGTTNWKIDNLDVHIGRSDIKIIASTQFGKVIEKSFVIDRMSTEVNLSEDMYVPDQAQCLEIMESIRGYWIDKHDKDNVRFALLMDEINPLKEALDKGNIAEGDILFIPANEKMTIEFVKMIVGQGELLDDYVYNDLNSDLQELYPQDEYPNEHYHIVYFKNVGFMDIFKDDIRISANSIDLDDPIAFSTFKNDVKINVTTSSGINVLNEPRLLSSNSNSISSSRNSSGIKLENIKIEPKVSFGGKSHEVTFQFLDCVIYDNDNDETTKNDQIKLNGKVGLNNLKFDTEIFWKPTLNDVLPQWIKCILTYDQITETNIKFNGKYSLKDMFFSGINSNFKFDNKREFDYNVLSLDINAEMTGVDMSDTLILGAIGINTAPVSAVIKKVKDISNDTIRIPLKPIIVVMLTMDINGEISCQIGLNYEYSQKYKKGFELRESDNKKEYKYEAGTSVYDLGFNRELIIYDEQSEPDKELFIEGKGKLEASVAPGVKVGLMTAGIMPAIISACVSFETKAEVEGKITIFPKFELDGFVSTQLDILLKAAMSLRLKAEAKKIGSVDIEMPPLEYEYPIFQYKYTTDGFKLEGTVYDGIIEAVNPISDKKPASTMVNKALSNVKISIVGTDANNSSINEECYSDTNGAYKIRGLKKGNYKITYSKKGYKDVITYQTINLDKKLYTTINRGKYDLKLLVKDKDGNAISDAIITINAKEYGVSEPQKKYNTKNNGECLISGLTAGTYSISVSKSGYFDNSLLIKLLENDSKNIMLAVPGKSKIHGKIVEADEDTDLINNMGLQGVIVRLVGLNEISSFTKTQITNSEGAYFLDQLPIGSYKLNISKDGYYPVEEYLTIYDNDPIVYNLALELVSTRYVGYGTAKGVVKDAETGLQVGPGFSIKVRKGINNRTGEILQVIKTDINGAYSLIAESGNYTLEIIDDRSNLDANVPRYITGTINVKILGGKIISNQDATITQQFKNSGMVRIVLTWGSQPTDLDSHLIGPSKEGGLFHVYYYNKKYGEYVELDVDDTNSYGPETTTIYIPIDSDTNYSFFVHDYSNISNSASNALSQSGATVKVYTGTSTPRVFNVPTTTSGNLWKVFSYNAKTQTITPINMIWFKSDPSKIGE
ncbi:cellulose binding domain-containing protein [Ruminiclostridium herbifermentans]|uniref:Cellulose binding domain-containing protein n=1 Tax=Ruminiclostridium herbifermentans TaxID=2488810 RepID=A0A4U7JIW0_9FIRM|nr:cellulose binding domain-containing protein [Ruminiclostridium herbifermentans]QNU68623.1 cellulose binding domain-containing protein [Ruminiclostridium herbifermentans]